MWKKSESNVRPAEVDKTSSSTIVYIHKNIVYVEATEMKDAHYEYDEMTVPKSDWELYEKLISHDTELDEVRDALIELSQIIGG